MTIKLRTHKYKKSVARRAMRGLTAESIENAQPVPMPINISEESFAPKKRKRGKKRQDSIPNQRSGVAPGLFGTGVDEDEMGASRSSTIALARARVTEQVPLFNQYPYSAIGKLTMVLPSTGQTFGGSAWVIGRKAIATAAHCLVEDTGEFFDPVYFYPSFSGSVNQDTYRVKLASVPDEYFTPGGVDVRYDFGVAVLNRDISQTTGFLGYDASGTVNSNRDFEGIGYPATSRPLHVHRDQFGHPLNNGVFDPVTHRFDGKKMWHSIGGHVFTNNKRHGFGNEMTEGSSGGPIVEEGGNKCFGLISTRDNVHQNRMYSPVLDDDFVEEVRWLVDNNAFF